MADNEHSSKDDHAAHQMAVFPVQLDTPDGPLKGRVSIYTGPTPLAGLVPPLFALTEGLVGLTLSRAKKEGKPATCRSGCSACCCQMVPLTVPEAFFLRDLVATLPPDRRREILKRFDDIAAELGKNGFYSRIMDPENSEDDYQKIALEYVYLRLPCPFLEQDRCSIYPMRPLACREYHVTTPAEWCADPRLHEIKSLKPKVAVPVVLTRLSAHLLELPARMIPLTLALRWAEDHLDLHRRAWPGRVLFEEFLARFNAAG